MFNYMERREKVFAALEPGSVVILKGAKEVIRNRDIEYDFRQNSYFDYLTGFNEPNAYFVMTKSFPDAAGICACKCVMYITPYDAAKAQWTGATASLENVPVKYEVAQALPIASIGEDMPKLLSAAQHFYFIQPQEGAEPLELELDTEKDTWLAACATAALTMHDLRRILDPMRLIKDDAEIQVLKDAASISAKAHIALMKSCRLGMREDQLGALFEFICRVNGCNSLAYHCVVAGGNNGWCLHWAASDAILEDGDLVLIDAGGELHDYATDITRTFPVNGKFSPEQKIIYNIVLRAQEAGIQTIKTGVNVKKIVDVIKGSLLAGLKEHGIINVEEDNPDEREQQEAAFLAKLFPHSFGHYLGLDVHDVGGRLQSDAGLLTNLPERAVITVEPGLYIAKDNLDVDARWRGISVRIEDTVIVRNDGAEVISSEVPKAVDEIETLMAEAAATADCRNYTCAENLIRMSMFTRNSQMNVNTAPVVDAAEAERRLYEAHQYY